MLELCLSIMFDCLIDSMFSVASSDLCITCVEILSMADVGENDEVVEDDVLDEKGGGVNS